MSVKQPFGAGAFLFVLLIAGGYVFYKDVSTKYNEVIDTVTAEISRNKTEELFASTPHRNLIIEEVATKEFKDCYLTHNNVGIMARWLRCDVNTYEVLTCTNSRDHTTCKPKVVQEVK